MSRRDAQIFELRCWRCEQTVEIPCSTVTDGRTHCPHCDAALELNWRAEDPDPADGDERPQFTQNEVEL